MGYFRHDDYVELTMHFGCNLRCEHCMIEGTMDRLQPESDSRFEEVLAYNAETRRWKGLILTGAEVTLRSDLQHMAQRARQMGFEHVRIQTHGMRMDNEKYCHQLVEAGIDEYFVSVTTSDAASHDAITAVPGSFDRTLHGLENLDRFNDVVTLTNTVVTKRSYTHLPAVVQRLSHLRQLVQMEFWNYWPMSETDEKDLVVSYLDMAPYLRGAIREARQLGRSVEVKNFPECLLGEDRDALDNSQPKLMIDPDFWSEFMRNGFHQCVHRSECGSRQCLGLNTAYVRKFGWQADSLTPLPVENPAVERP
jgi:MoaA/NifB/PqqE/SkfB family radical SAM enzyme